jgi:hypothetical protein
VQLYEKASISPSVNRHQYWVMIVVGRRRA